MDMKRILQAFDGASTRPVEGASDMSKFVRIVKEAQEIPPMPDVTGLQPGQSKDLGQGQQVTVNKDGTVSLTGGFGRYTYDKTGNAIKHDSPNFAGMSQSTDLTTGKMTKSYSQGPLNIKQGPDGETDAEYDFGIATAKMSKNAQGKTTGQMTVKESALKDKEDYDAKRKALQDIQMDPETDKDPELKAELVRRKADLEKEAEEKGIKESVKGFKEYLNLVEAKKMSAKEDPCWTGYHMVGKKKKGGKEVPNCVPGKKGD